MIPGPQFPVAGWDRYEPIRFLGQGGMGKVFLVRDLRLRREVAIKFVRGDDPLHIARLLKEARAQAHVDHERVCKVYEVGEVEGEVYITMQFVAGQTLSQVARELTVEQKAMVVRDAALGVHEAHRVGILHRDLKPGNIMVERGEDGRLKCYVMDFGLARDFTEGATETFSVAGTPHYMAPEQARGETQRVDRRADVYSLGATLYFVLTGQNAVPGKNVLEVVSNINKTDPRPLRSIDPDIPVDLEAITLRCLEKDKSDRYDSARALADDLARFLGGDPVEARPLGVWYRLRRRALKHRRLLVASAAASALLLLALGWGVEARLQARARERLAQRFTERVERIESMARYSALAPLHDVRDDRASIRAQMAEVEAEIDRGGALAVAPGRYALGRGYLALGEETRARELLESAWQLGYHQPRAAYALALVLGHLYAAGLREAERIQEKERREAKKRQLEKAYRDPALARLRESDGAEVPSRGYVAALVAFYEGRHAEALAQLDSLGNGLPWFHEAKELRGDILQARATQRWNAGDRDGALADFDEGRKAYAGAAAIGRSAPSVFQAWAELEHAALVMEIYGPGEVRGRFEQGLAAVDRVLAALPDHPPALLLAARLHRKLAEDGFNRGEKVDGLLATAISLAGKAVALAPGQTSGLLELGRSYWQLGAFQNEHSGDPREALQKARSVFEQIAAADRDHDYYVQLGLLHKTWADFEDASGADALENRTRAIEAYRTAISLDDRQFEAWVDLGVAWMARGENPGAAVAGADLQAALDALARAGALRPKHVVPLFYSGRVHRLLAERQRALGGDPGRHLKEALERYREGLALNPKIPQLHNGVGIILLQQALVAWESGGDPAPLLAEAAQAHRGAIAVAPRQALGYANLVWTLGRWAACLAAQGVDPTPKLREAEQAGQEALERDRGNADAWVNLAAAHAVGAEWRLQGGHDPAAPLRQAEDEVAHALERNPNHAQAHAVAAELLSLQARWLGRGGKLVPEFAAAAERHQRAIALGLLAQEQRVSFARLCAEWAARLRGASQDPQPVLERGLAALGPVLSARPQWPEAQAAHARLLLARAQAEAAGRRARAAEAAAELDAAVVKNGHLERDTRAELALARRLASTP